MSTTKVSVILITFNEEENIHHCLSSVQWADEVIVVDSLSTDNTVELASSYPNCKVISAAWKGFVPAKQLAISFATNDWVFWIDADEAVTPDLQAELLSLIETGCTSIAYDMPRKTFFMNQFIKPWYPGRVVRFFNKHRCAFSPNILHESVVPDSPNSLGHLRHDLVHHSYTSLFQYFQKMNWYGKYGAEELKRRKKKFQSWKLILSPAHAFLHFYFIKKGFMLGKSGLIIATGSAYSNFIKYANFYYLENSSSYLCVDEQKKRAPVN